MLAMSAREAIRDAIAAFAPNGAPKEIALPSPATHEAIFNCIQRVKTGAADELASVKDLVRNNFPVWSAEAPR